MTSFSKILANRLAQQQQPPAVHPEADTLNAFAENHLPPNERQTLLAHLAHCPDCREVLSLFAPDIPLHSANKSTWQNLRWPLAAAAMILLTFTVLHHKPTPQPIVLTPLAKPSPPADSPRIVATNQPAPMPTPHQAASAKKTLANTPTVLAVPRAAAPVLTAVPPSLEVALSQNSLRAPDVLAPPPPEPLRQSAALHAFARSNSSLLAMKLANESHHPSHTLWSLDSPSPGIIRRSDNGGIAWVNVNLNTPATPLSLAVAGPEIWLGCEHGVLLHSIDNGSTWNRIALSDASTELTEPITSIKAVSPATVSLKTPSTSWLSLDQGRTWQKQ